jgi:hypothetical protein
MSKKHEYILMIEADNPEFITEFYFNTRKEALAYARTAEPVGRMALLAKIPRGFRPPDSHGVVLNGPKH